eukprot:COSAG01_NODE_9575_length_2404_cov_28.777007_4_plen_126_part_00
MWQVIRALERAATKQEPGSDQLCNVVALGVQSPTQVGAGLLATPTPFPTPFVWDRSLGHAPPPNAFSNAFSYRPNAFSNAVSYRPNAFLVCCVAGGGGGAAEGAGDHVDAGRAGAGLELPAGQLR